MKLPGTEQAFNDLAKRRDSALDPVHPEGKHKAQVFAAALGLSRDGAEWLRDQLLLAAKNSDCAVGWWNPFPAAHQPNRRLSLESDINCASRRSRVSSCFALITQELATRR